MTKEQEEAIKRLKNMNDGYTFKDCDVCDNYNEETQCCDNKKCEELKAIETVLSLLEEKNEIIDLMSEVIMEDENLMCEINFEKWKSKKEVKIFFEKIVKEEIL